MISYLNGTTIYKGNGFATILTGGVGYKVRLNPNLLSKLELNKLTSIYVYTHVAETALDLYGFADASQLDLFEMFLTVSGVGPKTAQAIFSTGPVTKIRQAILESDVEFFTSVPRIGRKNAQKIIIELRGKIGSHDTSLPSDGSDSKDMIDALTSMGYSREEAREAIRSVSDLNLSLPDKIRESLKRLGKR